MEVIAEQSKDMQDGVIERGRKTAGSSKLSKVPSGGHTGSNGNNVLGDRTYPKSAGDEDGLVSFCSRQEGKFGGVEESFTRPAKNPERRAERRVGG